MPRRTGPKASLQRRFSRSTGRSGSWRRSEPEATKSTTMPDEPSTSEVCDRPRRGRCWAEEDRACMDALLSWVEELRLAVSVRTGAWPFAIVNTLHVVGIALLFGGIAVLDLRLLGTSRVIEVAKLARLVLPVAVIGFGLAAATGLLATGLLMFMSNAREY